MMDRQSAINVAVSSMGMDEKRVKKMDTNSLVRKVEAFLSVNSVAPAAPSKPKRVRALKANKERYAVGFRVKSAEGEKIFVLKYQFGMLDADRSTVLELSSNTPFRSYGKRKTAEKNVSAYLAAGPQYAGLEVIDVTKEVLG